MAIIENRVTEEGDVLIIRTNTPILGLISLSQFVDLTANESETDYFSKEFRYSQDGGLTWSEWIELTNTNLGLVDVSKYDSFVIEYRYTRVGNVPEVELEFENILVSGEIETLPYPIFNKTVFKQFFEVNDINVFGWALNVLEKIYEKGNILPDFYERGINRVNLDDEDFIAYWNSITHLFAIIVYYSRQFHNFQTNEILLNAFLDSRDLILPLDRDIEDILYIYENHIQEYRNRGTINILNRKSSEADVDGELVRLLNVGEFEELQFALFNNYDTGWCVGKSSPGWKYSENIIGLNKSYERTNKVLDLSKYPLVGSGSITLSNDKMKLSAASGECGIKYGSDESFKILVSQDLDYEISFRVNSAGAPLNFGVKSWGSTGTELVPSNVETDVDSNYFLSSYSVVKEGVDYFIRAILFNRNSNNIISKVNNGGGDNLIMKPNTCFIAPIITVTGDGSDTYIDMIKIRPLKLNFSRGQLGMRQIVYVQAQNNSNLDEIELKKTVIEKLIPYKCFLKTNFITEQEMGG